MTVLQLLIRNLSYYWRTNLAVIAGVIAATAVIGGALVVGDSVRDSLKQMSLDRLGKIDHAINGPRFFRQELAEELENASELAVKAAPVLIMRGTLEFEPSQEDDVNEAESESVAPVMNRVGQVNVYGLTDSAWGLLETGDVAVPGETEIVLNRSVADQLHANVGDEVSLIVEIPATIPRDSLLGERNETIAALPVTVSAITADELGVSRLGLNPNQQLPTNAYVNLGELQALVGLQEVERSKLNPIAKPARINGTFIAAARTEAVSDPLSLGSADTLTSSLKSQLTLEDLSLRLVQNEEHGYLSLESEQMFLEESVSDAALRTAEQMGVDTSPVLVYLLNEIRKPETPDQFSMYSVIAGIEPTDATPFGPFEFVGEHEPLTGNNVYLNHVVAEDIGAGVNDTINVKYHVVGDRGELPEDERQFHVAGIVKLAGVADDTGYTPNVPGVTDAETYDDWREPFPLKKDLIPTHDDEYWDEYRTTPKIFVSLETAQEIWRSKYGSLTSVRLAPAEGQSLAEFEQAFTTKFLENLSPQRLGLVVQPVKQLGLDASKGATDFTQLFLGFSFFLILSATMLVGLLFRLGIERRLSEVGLLTALGITPQRVRRLFLLEGGLLVVMGGLLGTLAAVGYAALMIHGLKTWWYGAIGTRFLFLSVTPVSLLAGFAIAVIVAAIAIWWALRQTKGRSIRQLLSGNVTDAVVAKKPWLARWTAIVCLVGSAILTPISMLGVVQQQEAFFGFSWSVVLFFTVGSMLLVGTLALLAALLGSRDRLSVHGVGSPAEARFGMRNASRNRTRSVLTASLIACATFLIVAVGVGQQNPTQETPNPRSGNGGFTLVAETNVPILYDLNTPEGRAKAGIDNQASAFPSTLNSPPSTIFPFRVRPGENASCLNLYQTQLPTVLGVPDDVLENMVERNRFLFANTSGEEPWRLLQEELPGGNIPVFGDMNTLMYSLHKNIGQTIAIPSEEDPKHRLEVRGMFANSVFQGVLVMSETNFNNLFPEQAGFQYFLIDVPPDQADGVSQYLESQLGDYGFDAERVSHRLANFLAVQNTYLSTFQTLGGLGLLLGTLGMATVMLRNVLERRGEFALLRSVGFRRSQIARLVIWENALLLFGGLAAGTFSALVAMAPHLMSSGADVPWTALVLTLASVAVIGLLAALGAVRSAVATPILETLRGN